MRRKALAPRRSTLRELLTSPQSLLNAMSLSLARQLLGRDGLGAGEFHSLLESARRLQRTAHEQGVSLALKGRHVAIAGGDREAAAAQLFERAAVRLGARVSRIGSEGLLEGPERSRHAARMLGSLYDAVDCLSLTPERAGELQEMAGVPFFSDLGGDASPLRELLPALAGPHAAYPADETMMCLIQAVLIEAMA
jgi:ornithine carbamoyltransferase